MAKSGRSNGIRQARRVKEALATQNAVAFERFLASVSATQKPADTNNR